MKLPMVLLFSLFLPQLATAQVLAPDGSYVGGSRAVLAPDGSYVGVE